MDNLRRTFLTKDEVRNLGMELTNQTTDDIQALYLPVRGLRDSLGTSSYISFKYRTKDHSDLQANAVGGRYNSYLGYDYDNYPIKLLHDQLSFTWSFGGYGAPCFYNVSFTKLVGKYRNSSSAAYASEVSIVDMMGDDVDYYVRLDITKFTISITGQDTTGYNRHTQVSDFLIQYLSGDVPADTIFYEPYEG